MVKTAATPAKQADNTTSTTAVQKKKFAVGANGKKVPVVKPAAVASATKKAISKPAAKAKTAPAKKAAAAQAKPGKADTAAGKKKAAVTVK